MLATGDFVNFDHASYIGAFSGDPNPLSVPAGTYYFETVGHKLRKTALNSFSQLRWQDAPWSELLPLGARYRGNHDGDADALHHLTMDGDVYHNDASPHRGIRQVSNFVAGSSSHTDYGTSRLAFVDDIPDLEDALFVERSSLPDATAADAPALVFPYPRTTGPAHGPTRSSPWGSRTPEWQGTRTAASRQPWAASTRRLRSWSCSA